MTQVQLTGFDQVRPSSAPTLAAGTASGSLTAAATYGYKVSFVTGYGETLPNVTAATIVVTSTGSVNLSAIPTGSSSNVTARKIYRTAANGSSYLLLDTISDNTTTTYTDTIIDASLGAAAPSFNTAHALQKISGEIQFTNLVAHSVEVGITAGAGGTTTAAYQLTAQRNIVATVTTTNDSIKLPPAKTAAIGTSIRIKNAHANTLRIFPYTGQTINGGSADAAITLATTVVIDLVCDSATNWTAC